MDENNQEGATSPLPEPIRSSAPSGEGVSVAPAWIPAEPAAAYAPPAPAVAPRAHQPVPRWVIVTAAAVAGVFLLTTVFGFGVAVGSHVSRFGRGPVGMMMQPPGGWGGEQGWQDDGHPGPRGRGDGGGGRGFPGSPQSPDAPTQP